jgi:hypothetical protein
MAGTRSIHGGRTYVYVQGDGAESDKPVAIFEDVSVSVSYGVQVPYVIGLHSGGEVVLTHMNPVQLSMRGFRKYNDGAYGAAGGMTKLQDLINGQRELTVVVMDRQNPGQSILTVKQGKVTGQNFNIAVRDLSRLSVEITGLTYEDESGVQTNPAGDVNYTAE